MDATVVITGGGAGLGAAIARTLAPRADPLVLGGPDVEALVAVEESIAEVDGELALVRADARDEFDLERLMETAARRGEGIDVLIPAAEVHHGSGGSSIASASYSAFDDTFRTNVRGVFAAVREAIPHFAGEGWILVPVAPRSGAVERAAGTYRASKHAVRGLIETLATDLDHSVVGIDHGVPVPSHAEEAELDDAAGLFAQALEYDGEA
ncbi:MAG: SDR family NAD(P)-dependent oxidoreductase, partial [Halodesulfurarchaeum sp.]